MNAASGTGTQDSAGNGFWATGKAEDGKNHYPVVSGYSSTANTTMADGAVTVDITGSAGGITGGSVTIDSTGNNSPVYMWQPTLGMSYIIAMRGIFPSRN